MLKKKNVDSKVLGSNAIGEIWYISRCLLILQTWEDFFNLFSVDLVTRFFNQKNTWLFEHLNASNFQQQTRTSTKKKKAISCTTSGLWETSDAPSKKLLLPRFEMASTLKNMWDKNYMTNICGEISDILEFSN